MKLTFLGTRGNIKVRNKRHFMHSSLMVSHYGHQMMIDCGEDWHGKIDSLNPLAIIITHAHPDHAWGLKQGAPCPVYASRESWEIMEKFKIKERRTVTYQTEIQIKSLILKAFRVEHSTRAPASGYRIEAGRVSVFYVPDVVYVHNLKKALHNVKLFIGDGATVTRSMVRKPKGNLIGHTPIRTQLTWCQKQGIKKAIFSHCGSEIVEGDERTIQATINKMAKQREVEAKIAHDGLQIVLR